MIAKIIQINEALAVWLTKAFGAMWICYAFMVYGLLPAFAIFHPYQDAFLYWSNWIQLWSLPLILVGTNILGRDAEERSKLDHEKLAKSYEEQQQTYIQIIAMLKKQEEVMADLVAQDKVLEAQDIVLEEQTKLLKGGDDIFKESVMPIQSIPDLTAGCFQSHLIFIGTALIRNYPLRTPGLSSLPRTTKPRRPRSTRFVSM